MFLAETALAPVRRVSQPRQLARLESVDISLARSMAPAAANPGLAALGLAYLYYSTSDYCVHIECE